MRLPRPQRFVFLGLSITSSWGNGHATTYRALIRALTDRGHDVLFLERDVEWYASNRDLEEPPFGRVALYRSVDELTDRWHQAIRTADCVVVGSYVPDGIVVSDWVLSTATGVTGFYDIDTPITLAALERGEPSYISRAQIPRFDLYLSFTGGPTLERLEGELGARRARPLYCSFDPACYFPVPAAPCWDLGYMGTYSPDRQPLLEQLLTRVAERTPRGRFVVAGASYPGETAWPANVHRIEHLHQAQHRDFYTAQRFTLNLTRREMARVGYSPSVRLFEAAACGTPIISDAWEGLESFFVPGRDILIAETTEDAFRHLHDIGESERRALGERARAQVLNAHTPRHRAAELECYVTEAALARQEQAS